MVHPCINECHLLPKEALLPREAVAQQQQLHCTRPRIHREELVRLLAPRPSGPEHKVSSGALGRIASRIQAVRE